MTKIDFSTFYCMDKIGYTYYHKNLVLGTLLPKCQDNMISDVVCVTVNDTTANTVFTLINAPGVDIYFSDFTPNLSDFTLKTQIFNQICLFDDEKVHFDHIL